MLSCSCACCCCPRLDRAPNQQEDLIISWGNKLVSYKHTEGKGREGRGERVFIHSSHWFAMLSILFLLHVFASLWKWLLVCCGPFCCYSQSQCCFHSSSNLTNCMNLWMNKWSPSQWTKSSLTFPYSTGMVQNLVVLSSLPLPPYLFFKKK